MIWSSLFFSLLLVLHLRFLFLFFWTVLFPFWLVKYDGTILSFFFLFLSYFLSTPSFHFISSYLRPPPFPRKLWILFTFLCMLRCFVVSCSVFFCSVFTLLLLITHPPSPSPSIFSSFFSFFGNCVYVRIRICISICICLCVYVCMCVVRCIASMDDENI